MTLINDLNKVKYRGWLGQHDHVIKKAELFRFPTEFLIFLKALKARGSVWKARTRVLKQRSNFWESDLLKAFWPLNSSSRIHYKKHSWIREIKVFICEWNTGEYGNILCIREWVYRYTFYVSMNKISYTSLFNICEKILCHIQNTVHKIFNYYH